MATWPQKPIKIQVMRKKTHLFQSDKNKASLPVIRGCRWHPPPRQFPSLPAVWEARLRHFAGAAQHFLTLMRVLRLAARNPVNIGVPQAAPQLFYSGEQISGDEEGRSHLFVRGHRTTSLCSFSQKLTTPVCAPSPLYKQHSLLLCSP